MENMLEKQVYEERKEYGGFWIRFAAYLIDGIIVGIPLGIIIALIYMLFILPTGIIDLINTDPAYIDQVITDEQIWMFMGSYLGATFVSLLIGFAASIAYFAGLHASKWQGTVGKKLLGLKVTDLNGQRITFWRALGRYLAMSFLSGILLVGYIIAGFTERKQSLHDLIASTIVIKNS
ncbi:putative RDD family membrane protein YckC [Cytobacillus eiseniae]|uniref:RDD family membrane protein YckC n=1 Tax=Cytobacillus eiseniae TaxID=762947 RepID=A0ABS4RC70_9BACI|nr:RDD family protein [Cytobacillus eiseniae]MBP2239939.1 putative RDD family membrane protein YckC [Cytobacillus eiseniae]